MKKSVKRNIKLWSLYQEVGKTIENIAKESNEKRVLPETGDAIIF